MLKTIHSHLGVVHPVSSPVVVLNLARGFIPVGFVEPLELSSFPCHLNVVLYDVPTVGHSDREEICCIKAEFQSVKIASQKCL